jgi:hypothetical protein
VSGQRDSLWAFWRCDFTRREGITFTYDTRLCGEMWVPNEHVHEFADELRWMASTVESRGGDTAPSTTVDLGELDAINGLLWGPEREIFRDDLANTRIAPHITEGARYHVSVVLRRVP